MAAIKPALVLSKIERAARLLGVEPEWIMSKSGLSPSLVRELRAGNSLPSMQKLSALAEKTGLPVEFFLSTREPNVAHVRFREGSKSVESETEVEEYYLRREILRLGSLVDLLVNLPQRSNDQPLMRIRSKLDCDVHHLASLVLDSIEIRPDKPPIGPGLIRKLDMLGVALVFYPIFNRAKAIGLSWWHDGRLPVVVVASWVGMRRAYFTVAHELFHLIRHLPCCGTSEGYKCKAVPSIQSAGCQREELEANEFAACLLMPDVVKAEAKRALMNVSITTAVGKLSGEWEVSRQAIALRLVSWGLVRKSDIAVFFPESRSFAQPDPRPPEERFGTPRQTRDTLERLHEAGSSARYISWVTKLPYEIVLRELGRLRPEEVASNV